MKQSLGLFQSPQMAKTHICIFTLMLFPPTWTPKLVVPDEKRFLVHRLQVKKFADCQKEDLPDSDIFAQSVKEVEKESEEKGVSALALVRFIYDDSEGRASCCAQLSVKTLSRPVVQIPEWQQKFREAVEWNP